MEKGKISIIVPVYRAESYLKRCVDSLLGQTFEAVEILLVDDGSPDRCPALCEEYAALDGRVTVIHKENGGLTSAWQAGVRKSSGQYLCFVDSDDWVEKEMLSGMVPFLTGKGGEIVCCNFVINRPDRVTEHYHGLPPGVYEGSRLREVKGRLLGNENRTVSMSRCMKLFSRELIEDNMKYCASGITMGEDVNITLPALLDCKRLAIMEGALYYHYFYNEESMVHRYDAGLYGGIRTLYRAMTRILEDKGEKTGDRTAALDDCAREYEYLLLLAVKNELRGGAAPVKNIRGICLEEENRKIIRAYPIEVKEPASRLLYFALKRPWPPALLSLKALFWLYDRRKGA